MKEYEESDNVQEQADQAKEAAQQDAGWENALGQEGIEKAKEVGSDLQDSGSSFAGEADGDVSPSPSPDASGDSDGSPQREREISR